MWPYCDQGMLLLGLSAEWQLNIEGTFQKKDNFASLSGYKSGNALSVTPLLRINK